MEATLTTKFHGVTIKPTISLLQAGQHAGSAYIHF